MSMRISLKDGGGTEVNIIVSSTYNPDILDDLQRRASRSYKKMLRQQEKAGFDCGAFEDEADEVEAESAEPAE